VPHSVGLGRIILTLALTITPNSKPQNNLIKRADVLDVDFCNVVVLWSLSWFCKNGLAYITGFLGADIRGRG